MFFPPLIFLMMLVFFVLAVILLPFLLLGMIGEAFLRLGLPPAWSSRCLSSPCWAAW